MSKVRYLRAYLVFFGALNILTSFSVPLLFGNEVLWSPRNLPTDLMVASLYFPMGIIMLLVAKTPEKHKAFIDFVIISSVLHSVIMIVYAQSALHIALDAVFMATMGAVPLFVYPWGLKRFLQY